MTFRRYACAVSLLAGLLRLAPLAHSQEIAAGSKSECVGRYQIALPGNIEVALTLPEALTREVDDPIRFKDGQPAPYSRFIYDGGFRITGPITPSAFEAFVARLKANFAKASEADASSVRPYPVGLKNAYGWISQYSLGFHAYRAGRIFSYTATGLDNLNAAKRHASLVASHFSTRALYAIPAGDGACLPYSFIGDDGHDENRQIGVTFRLVTHPDVTVFFLDKKARATDPKQSSRQKSKFVWGSEYGMGEQIKLRGAKPYRPVKLDGREGIATSATITRGDNAIDYGYLAVVQGDAKATDDTPNLLLLVQRTAADANGRPPVSQDELERIAGGIAASIRRRPVQ